ncbi:MAG: GNAT family N-acetyltransferase [Synergistota bacterium]|nr:GNAT family N-acetyltransferase [Synergistota bacterium]
MDRYFVRRADFSKDIDDLRVFFNRVFEPEKVGEFASNLMRHFPGMNGDLWFVAEERDSGDIAAACALLPWRWRMGKIRLKVAEMGIVGTGEAHRHRGLMRRLHSELMDTVRRESYHLVVIQGIPGFYDRLGFRFALPLCSHIDLPLHGIPGEPPLGVSVRSATVDDIPFLMEEDELFGSSNFVSALRGPEVWRYLLNEGQSTEYGSDFLVIEAPTGRRSYARISRQGFGEGLIVSEVGERMSHQMAVGFMNYCLRLAGKREKPYVRLDLHPEAPMSKLAIASGASSEETYAWQVSIPDVKRLLTVMVPILEDRIACGVFEGYTGRVRLDFFDDSLDLVWINGKLEDIRAGDDGECDAHFFIHKELFPALCLGHRTWRELRANRPDIFPALSNVGPRTGRFGDFTGTFIDELFPRRRSWVYEQY